MERGLAETAREEWKAGRTLEAGRILHEHLQPQQRPGWAAAALELVRPHFPAVPEIEAVLEIARCSSRWPEGHAAFDAVRGLTLQAERSAPHDLRHPLYYSFLMLAENTAKVTYNASGPNDPFDLDSGWWVASCLRGLVDLVGDPILLREAWEVMTREAVCSHWEYVSASFGKAEAGVILAAPDVRDAYGATALMYAAFIGCSFITRKLLEHGAYVNARDERGGTALMYAVEPGDPVLIHLLVDAGAEVNAATVDGDTALMAAAVHGIPSVVHALLRRRADVHARDRAGKTALSRVEQRNPAIADLLRGAGAIE
jgi:hypothetical protein